MKLYKMLFLLVLASPGAKAQFEVHEWGTFTSLVGSDGISQHGMYHEDEKLPSFVHGFGETQELQSNNNTPCVTKSCLFMNTLQQNQITQKMETPVIYFYGTPPLGQRVKVKVDFPDGVITETYPAPIASSPKNSQTVEIKNGTATFDVEVLPSTIGVLPYVDSGNIYAHARNTQSQLVRTNSETEKFIFYRGVGRFQPKVSITSNDEGLRIKASETDLPSALFLVSTDSNGRTQMMSVHKSNVVRDGFHLSKTSIESLMNEFPSTENKVTMNDNSILEQLAEALVNVGLFKDEARAMVKTWEHGYLKTPGLRLLYIVPSAEVEKILPMQITPAPQSLKRAFVARIEIMPKFEEDRLIAQIEKEKHLFNVAQLGRFAEPRLRRIQQVYNRSQSAKSDVSAIIQNLVNQTLPVSENIKGSLN